MQVVVVSGLAGAGKSTVAKALEDLGYFCVDNLPAALMDRLVSLAESSGGEVNKVALVVDAREGRFLRQFPDSFAALRNAVEDVALVFLEAKDDALIRRFSETRRRHPLAQDGTVAEGIARERAILTPVRDLADQVIDTSSFTVHELKRFIVERFGATGGKGTMTVTLLSFGFKHGVPSELDLCADVRFLPNPHFVDSLRPLTGADPPVSSYVLERPAAQEFVQRYTGLLAFLLPHYAQEGKKYLTIGIGCTGGQHRSVAICIEVARRLTESGFTVRVRHRDAPVPREGG